VPKRVGAVLGVVAADLNATGAFNGFVDIGRKEHAMDVQGREAFAREWLRGWKERDLTTVVEHYSDDVEFQSPVAVHPFGETFRMIRGKKDLTNYFERALASVQEKIEFEFLGVFHGVDTMVVHFQPKTHKFAEFMELNQEGKVCRARAHLQA